ncbi:hypothetical protein NKH92_28965 [Mesorhizobium sp. M0871]
MTLELIGAGFGRTGTWSTFAALNRLGLPSYHMQEVILNKANKGHLDFWRKVARPAASTTGPESLPITRRRSTIRDAACGAN